VALVCLVLNAHGSFGTAWKEAVRACGCKLIEVGAVSEGSRLLEAHNANLPGLIIAGASGGSDDKGLSMALSLRESRRNIPIFLLARNGSEELAVAGLRSRVNDYFRMPAETEALVRAVRALAAAQTKPEGAPEESLIGSTEVMLRTKARLARVANSDANVLITGETGTGKELAATVIHELSGRSSGPLVCVNCAAIPDTLLESEMFGYERGAFTGASSRKAGWLEAADSGTLFLDEIGDLSATAQAKLLRVIENKPYCRLGGHSSLTPKLRFVAATHRDLEKMASEGQFRPDLFYRLNVARVHLPALREHREDIPLLLHHYIREFNRGAGNLEFTEEVWNCLMSYDWPGNIRELKNVLEGLAVNALENRIQISDLPPAVRGKLADPSPDRLTEREKVLSALLSTKWNKSKAADRLHWSRMTLYRKLNKYHLVTPPR
jgi:DNA-binding NtrC family response regulator